MNVLPQGKSSPQVSVLTQAKQGHPGAIAALINRHLQPQGLVAQVACRDDCVQVLVQAASTLTSEWDLGTTETPKAPQASGSTHYAGRTETATSGAVPAIAQIDRDRLVAFLERGIRALELPSLQRLQIYGGPLVGGQPTWRYQVSLGPSSPTSSPTPSQTLSPTSSPTLLQSPVQSPIPATVPASPTPTAHSEIAPPTPQPQAAIAPSAPSATITQFRITEQRRSPWWMRGSSWALLGIGGVGLVALLGVFSLSAKLTPAERQRSELNPQQQALVTYRYLTAISQAQAQYYDENREFAWTIQDLPLPAEALDTSGNYDYHLLPEAETRLKIIAIPKNSQLHSFTTGVLIQSKQGASISSKAITCISRKPSFTPPGMPTVVNGNDLTCPPDSTAFRPPS